MKDPLYLGYGEKTEWTCKIRCITVHKPLVLIRKSKDRFGMTLSSMLTII